jgi:hypothetical protein
MPPVTPDPRIPPPVVRVGGFSQLAVAAATVEFSDGDELRLRGKDSNLDYLIQSQASYH